MRSFLGWAAVAVAAVAELAACGGSVVVDYTSSGAGGFGGATTTTTSGISGTGGVVGTSTNTGVFDGVGGACVGSCAQALTNGGVPCSGAGLNQYQQLAACIGCNGKGVCASNVDCVQFCQSGPLNPSCSMCASVNCNKVLDACNNN